MNQKSDLVKQVNADFTESSLLRKIRKVFKLAGKGLTEKIFLLYNLLKDENVPKNVKLIIASGLSYFILPFDTIPDFLVGLGFSDDLAVILGIVYMLTTHVTNEHKLKAKEMVDEIFGKN